MEEIKKKWRISKIANRLLLVIVKKKLSSFTSLFCIYLFVFLCNKFRLRKNQKNRIREEY